KLVTDAQGSKRAPPERAFGVVAGGKRRTVSGVRISNQREQRTALHSRRRRLPQRVEKGRRQIHQARRGLDALADKTLAGKFEEQGYVDGSVVKENAVGHFAASLHGSLAALPGLLPVKACVVDIEAALESGGKPVFWVEDDAADEGPRVVALGVESIG